MMFDMLHIAILVIGLLVVFSIGFYLGWLYKYVSVINYNKEIADKVSQDIVNEFLTNRDMENKYYAIDKIKQLVLLELDK